MKLGAILPGRFLPADPAALADFAQAVEDLGYTHLLTLEHVAGTDPSHRPHRDGAAALEDYHEPLVLFGYLAGLTRRLELVTDILVLPQRQTVLVAQQAAEVDVLSHGRLRLGVGVGWAEPEFQALGEDFHTRGKRVEEQIAVLRALWTQEVVTFHGRWHHLDEMGIRPRPLQRPIPIWLGGTANASLRRVATIGDGWMENYAADVDARQCIERIHRYAREAGRDPHTFGIQAHVSLVDKTPDDWRREIESWRMLGATHLAAGVGHAGVGPLKAPYVGASALQAHLDLLRRFKDVADSVEQT
jgi:probable F420-dependent oxidoreductase